MPIDTTLKSYRDRLPKVVQVQDCINEIVKDKGVTYLPKPDPDNLGPENTTRYEQYKTRAVFVNVTKRTHDGMLGAVYRKAPMIKLPPSIAYLEENADGSGMGLIQFSKRSLSDTAQSGRDGILVDYPPRPDDVKLTAGGEEKEKLITQSDTKGLKATLVGYNFSQIINWRMDAGKLLLVVLREVYETTNDGFEYEVKDQYRELRMEDGFYIQRLWRESELVEIVQPTMFSGARWDRIPFEFVGTINNDSDLDPSLLFGLSELNIGHYRNSADLEENCYIHGQLTLGVVSEMSGAEFKESNPSGIQVGSRRGHFLGKGGDFVSVQAEPNQLADKLMERKEKQMLAIGARLIEQGGTNETAEGVRARTGADSANLSSLAHNVSSAMKQALMWAADFMGPPGQEVVFTLNQEFYPETLDAQMAAALIQLYDRGRIGAIDLHRKLQASGNIADDRELETIESEANSLSPLSGANINVVE
jgi:hypothetical protein